MDNITSNLLPKIDLEHITALNNDDDIHAICESIEAAILAGYHCRWVKAPPRHLLESYIKGSLLVPEKTLFTGRLDGHIVSFCEVETPPKEIETPFISAYINIFAVAPYAINVGISRRLLLKVEQTIAQLGFPIINVQIDESQKKLFQFYLDNGYHHWATHPYYRKINGQIVRGFFLYKSFLNTPSF